MLNRVQRRVVDELLDARKEHGHYPEDARERLLEAFGGDIDRAEWAMAAAIYERALGSPDPDLN